MSQTQPNAAIRTSAKPLTMEYNVMFDRVIEDCSEFQEELHVIRNTAEGDVCNFRISTDGGCVSTVIAVHGAVQKSSAQFHGILESKAYSAGSMLFLMCDTQEVYPLSSMYIHTAQSGMGGHSQEMAAYGKFIEEEAEALVKTCYADFLTDAEIAKVLNGGVIYLNAPAIEERLGKRDEIRNARLDEEELAAFNEKYDANSYAEELLQNLTEELEGSDFNLTDVFTSMTKLLQGKVTDGLLEEDVELIEEEVFVGKGGIEITEGFLMELSKPELKNIATDLDITFGNATNMKTLRELILAVVK